MMERESRPHDGEPSGAIDEHALIRSLKEKGIDDPEVKALLLAWTQQQERLVEALTGEAHTLAQLRFELKRARLYHEAGYKEAAIETLNAAQDLASNATVGEEAVGKMWEEMDVVRSELN